MYAAFNIFPLILIPVLIYNLVVFGGTVIGSTAKAVREKMADPAFVVPMASGTNWVVQWGDILVLVGLVLLFVELLKSTATGSQAIFNHALSMIVFIVSLTEFLLHPAFATSVFFILLAMSLLDVLAGVVVTIVSARRDVDFEHGRG